MVYVLALKRVGYIISSYVLMFVLSTLLADDNKPKLWKRLLFAAFMVALTYGLFHFVIKISLPEGTWIKALRKSLR